MVLVCSYSQTLNLITNRTKKQNGNHVFLMQLEEIMENFEITSLKARKTA